MTYVDRLDTEFLSRFIPREVLVPEECLHCSVFGSHLYGTASRTSPVDFLLITRNPDYVVKEAQHAKIHRLSLNRFTALLKSGDRLATESLFNRHFSFSVPAFQYLRAHAPRFISLPYLQILRGGVRSHMEYCYFDKFDLKSAYLCFVSAWTLRYVLQSGSLPLFNGKTWEWLQDLRMGAVTHEEFKTQLIRILTDLEELKYLIESYPPAPFAIINVWESFMASSD